jgi:FkbM family methyltransferase
MKAHLISFLKKILFRQWIKASYLQSVWGWGQTVSLFGMNYGGGGLIETSGEVWVLDNVVRRLLRQDQRAIVFDVGANVGDYSLLVRQKLPHASVYAFEPSRKTFAALTSVAGPADIKPYNTGFSDTRRTIELFSYAIEGQDVSLLSSIDRRLPTQVVEVSVSNSEEIEVRTIDEFCATEGIERIDFLKLDVEGHELAVLRGAANMLDGGAISLIQFEFGPANIYSRTYFYDFWTTLNDSYKLFRIVPNGIVPIKYYGEHREVFLTTNYLAVKKQLSL